MQTCTRSDMDAAIKILRANGWEQILSVTRIPHDPNLEYGILFMRGNEKFWLNKDTIGNLQTDLGLRPS